MNNQRYIVLVFFLTGVLTGATVRGLGLPLLANLEIADPQILGMFNGSSIAAVVVTFLTFFVLLRNRAATSFVDESVTELRKTTWPNKEETVRSTTVVIGTTFFLAATLACYDLLWAKLTSLFIYTQS